MSQRTFAHPVHFSSRSVLAFLASTEFLIVSCEETFTYLLNRPGPLTLTHSPNETHIHVRLVPLFSIFYFRYKISKSPCNAPAALML
jgi:hypothetical protein